MAVAPPPSFSSSPHSLGLREENSQWNKEDMQLSGSQVEPRGIGVDWRKQILFSAPALLSILNLEKWSTRTGATTAHLCPIKQQGFYFWQRGFRTKNIKHGPLAEAELTYSQKTLCRQTAFARLNASQRGSSGLLFRIISTVVVVFFFFCPSRKTIWCHSVYIGTRKQQLLALSLSHD